MIYIVFQFCFFFLIGCYTEQRQCFRWEQVHPGYIYTNRISKTWWAVSCGRDKKGIQDNSNNDVTSRVRLIDRRGRSGSGKREYIPFWSYGVWDAWGPVKCRSPAEKPFSVTGAQEIALGWTWKLVIHYHCCGFCGNWIFIYMDFMAIIIYIIIHIWMKMYVAKENEEIKNETVGHILI